MAYDVADKAVCSIRFSDPATPDPNGDPITGYAYIDPTTVRFRYRRDAGAITTLVYGTDPEVVKDGTGRYHVELDLNAAGTWHYRFEGTGTHQAAAERSLTVRASSF